MSRQNAGFSVVFCAAGWLFHAPAHDETNRLEPIVPLADDIPDPLRILHLEDNPDDADLIRLTLVKDGFNVEITRVDSFAGFLNALKRQPVDLLLSDCNLPSFDGLKR